MNSGFILKSMYEGIIFKAIRNTPITNDNILDQEAIQLIAYHPKGYGLFKLMPEIEDFDIPTALNNIPVRFYNHQNQLLQFSLNNVIAVFDNLPNLKVKSKTQYNYEHYFKKLKNAKKIQVLNALD